MKKPESASEAESTNDADLQETATEQTGRDRRGRFTAGNAGGPGNPFARRVALLRTILMECVSDEEMRNIAGQLVVMAKTGDLAAIKLLFQYVLGKPAATVDPDTLDQKEVEWFCAEPFSTVLKELIGTRTPSDVVARFFRGVMPSIGDTQAEMIREACLNPEAFKVEEDEDDLDEEDEAVEEARQVAGRGTRGTSQFARWRHRQQTANTKSIAARERHDLPKTAARERPNRVRGQKIMGGTVTRRSGTVVGRSLTRDNRNNPTSKG